MPHNRLSSPFSGPRAPRIPPSVLRSLTVIRSKMPSRLIKVQTLARIIYQHNGRDYLRIDCANEEIRLINMETGKPFRLPRGSRLTNDMLERMIAEKRIIRRLQVGDEDTLNTALIDYLRSGGSMSEFVPITTVRLVPYHHKPIGRSMAGQRVKRLS